jgi:hypothetical protein
MNRNGNVRVQLVRKHDRREEILERILDEWTRTPGLRVDVAAAQARWDLAADTCLQLLELLCRERVVLRHEDGTFSLANR